MNFVCLGDSLTYGYGVKEEENWVTLLEKKSGFNFINAGINGQTSLQIRNRMDQDVVFKHPDAVIVTAGSNDFIFSINDEHVAFENIKEMVKKAFHHNIIPVIGIPPLTVPFMAERQWDSESDYDFVNKQLHHYKEMLVSYAQKQKITTIDFHSALAQILTDDNCFSYLIDGLHPTPLGQQVLWQVALDALTKSGLLL